MMTAVVCLFRPGNAFGKSGATTLAGHLERCTTLQELHLSCVGMEDDGCAAVVRALGQSRTTVLDLSSNLLGPASARLLGHLLRFTTTMTSLLLRNNTVGVKGTVYLREALRINRTLTYLDVSGNQIGLQGAGNIAFALQKNSVLKEWYVSTHRWPPHCEGLAVHL